MRAVPPSPHWAWPWRGGRQRRRASAAYVLLTWFGVFFRTWRGDHRFPPFYDDSAFGIYQKILAGRIDFPKCVPLAVASPAVMAWLPCCTSHNRGRTRCAWSAGNLT